VTDSATRKTDDRSRWLRCLGRLAFTAPMALVCLLLALGDPSALTVTVFVVGLWLWLAVSVVAGIARFMIAAGAAASTQQNPSHVIYDIPGVCAWTSLLLLAVATGALFAAGEPALAKMMEVFLFLRLATWIAADDPAGSKKDEKDETEEIQATIGAMGFLTILLIAGALWLALGAPPAWAASIILTWVWIFTLFMIVASSMLALAFTFGPGMQNSHWREWRRREGRWDLPESPPESPTRPEPTRTPRQHLAMWLWRAGWFIAAWALWTAGHPLLGGLYLLACMLMLSARAHQRRRKHGDTARIDFLARAIDFVIWWPLVAVGAAGAAAVLVPLGILGAIWDRIMGAPPPGKPEPSTNWEREQRLTRARVRRAAASYRLREEFGMPGGFVYLLYSEPHQREHFLGAGGLLHGMEDQVVARDWRGDVTPARKAIGWTRFEQTPEGALLHVNGVGSMQKDLPLIAVAPVRGTVQIFRLSEAYRARRRDKGAALEKAEMDVRAAIAVVLGPGAE